MPKLPPGLLAKVLPILIFVIPLAHNYGFVVDHFYTCGAAAEESGLLANLGWQNTWALTPPSVLNRGPSFLETHVFGLFWLTSALSYVLPLNMVQSYALYKGIYHALPAVTVYGFLVAQFPGLRQGWRRVGAAFLGLLFAFNGISQVLMDDTHPEVSGATFLILFLALWARRCYGWALLPFGLCLLAREDMGFHVVGVLGLVLVFQGLNRQAFWRDPAGRWTLGFSVVAIAYTLGAMGLQDWLFPGGDDALTRVYLGDPALAHLSVAFFQERFADQLRNLHYLYLPAIATAILAVYPRYRPSLLIGFLAYLPWYALHSIAVVGGAGTLTKYYAFPYVISLAWPLVWPWMTSATPTASTKRWGVQVFVVGVILSILGAALSPNAKTVDLSHFGRSVNISAFNAVTTAAAVQADWGQVYVDDSVAVLLPQEFAPENWLRRLDPHAWVTHDHHDNLQPADNLLYCEPPLKPEGVEAVLRSQSFKHHYRLKGTPLRLQTNWEPEQFHPHWAQLLESN